MKAFKFINKHQARTYSVFTFLGVIIAVFIFYGLDTFLSNGFAYLIVTTLSLVSIIITGRRASKECSEIRITDENIELSFFNNLKKDIRINKKDIRIEMESDKIVLFDSTNQSFIGRAYKYKIEHKEQWNKLIDSLKTVMK